MKKALHISIAQTLFVIEEDAHARLDAYLNSVRDHFTSTEGHEEIQNDIEARIAEQLLESGEKVITLPTVERILDIMGEVEDFDESPSPGPAASSAGSQERKFYRNPDDMLIAGVCSGLGAYLGIDPVWVRLVFIASVFLSGFGILLYAILWLIAPEARTRAQKLEMYGSPITLETLGKNFTNTVREQMKTIQSKSSGWKEGLRKAIAFPFRLIGSLVRGIVRMTGPVLRVTTGIILVITSVCVLIAAMIAGGALVSENIMLFENITFQSLLPGTAHWMLAAGIALAIGVPAFFVFLGGISLLRKRNMFTAPASFSLFAVWLASLVALGFGGTQAAANYQTMVAISPAYQPVTRSLPVSGRITGVEARNGMRLTVVHGTTTSLTATGKESAIQRINAQEENGTLVLRHLSAPEQFCLFCFDNEPELMLTIPSPVESFHIALQHGSDARANMSAQNLRVELTNGSYLSLAGSASTSEFTLKHGSLLDGMQFTAGEAAVQASNGSRAELTVSKSLQAFAEHGSEIVYATSSPDVEVTEEARNGSEIYSQ
jgi:phage shock protein PspC (stress-responsive transcriptional regulator)